MTVQDQLRYSRETVRLDGEAFTDCEFTDCRLVYAGGETPTFSNCRFQNCEWRFEEAAAQTLAHLKLMWKVGAKADVQAAIKDITAVAR